MEIDTGTEFGARAARRLAEEQTAWLTLVGNDGVPQPSPVWFLWDGASALVYSLTGARRLTHLDARPAAAMHLDALGGGDIVVLTGAIERAPDEPPVVDNPAYLEKYGAAIDAGTWWDSREAFGAMYSVPLRFRPTALRGH